MIGLLGDEGARENYIFVVLRVFSLAKFLILSITLLLISKRRLGLNAICCVWGGSV